MQYAQIWNAVDKLAQHRGLSASGLAKAAGLDSTTFNKSKRIRPDGKKRWPSLDSINKLLETCNLTFEQFYNLGAEDCESVEPSNTIPFIKYSASGQTVKLENGKIDTSDWGRIAFPDSGNIYAIELDTNDYAPFYRINTLLVVTQNSDIRRGDRVVVHLNAGNTIVGEFVRRTAQTIELNNILPSSAPISVAVQKIVAVQRIVWASQ